MNNCYHCNMLTNVCMSLLTIDTQWSGVVRCNVKITGGRKRNLIAVAHFPLYFFKSRAYSLQVQIRNTSVKMKYTCCDILYFCDKFVHIPSVIITDTKPNIKLTRVLKCTQLRSILTIIFMYINRYHYWSMHLCIHIFLFFFLCIL